MSTNDLKSRIFATGPIPVAAYMKQVLTNPTAGYCMTTKDVLGKKGNLITSPEIVKIFDEMIVVWCVNKWYKLGRPAPLQLSWDQEKEPWCLIFCGCSIR